MNTFPGPENSWEGVDAYFTYANSEGALIFWTLFVIALCVLVTMATARHESDTAKKNKIMYNLRRGFIPAL